ncbi:type II toxin-antitoxin system RelE/ParE family toxin [Lederbergia sp. NSJ-179]|uniref:type II toxin-antitoxin system RelE/ParE family toxin n=1 Tax=Lederbergia sp. NSJ-179 TaxID=2931402 RepID=UPI001FD40D63|nr:type II toxin-antitoxin system RelE/ParE family toxin [Lederbergia sp. NSJ-179]MCJ7842567.1 type II toxin-antitoxin system RelE/ParE family toxin [Lederbergia sp. NSJ-179]
MKWETIEYTKPNGVAPVIEYLQSLSPKHETKVLRSIQLLEEFGPEIGMPHVRHLNDGIYELRTSFSSNIFRTLFFHWHENKLVLTHGFTKKTQKTPAREIRRAEMYRRDYLERKGDKE